MNAVLHIKSDHEQIRRHREGLARRVLNEFSFTPPSNPQVLCYLDDRDVEWLMWYTIAPVDPVSNTISWPYVSVIYLHGSTCESDIQLAMTLAHELQHFVQFVSDRQLWAVHLLLTKLPGLPAHNLKHWFDLPNEIEARIIAKRAAEKLFGQAEVERHIAMMIAARTSDEDAADWEFIRTLDPNSNYDMRERTIPLVNDHRSQLEYLKTMIFANDKDLGAVDFNLQ